MAFHSLSGTRVAVLAADGFEQAELVQPLKQLRKAGADVQIVSLRPGHIRGMKLLERAGQQRVDQTLFSARPDEYDALYLPGGFISPDLLRQSERALEFVRAFEQAGKPIAVTCHGAWVLISAGLVQQRRLTSWPGIAADVRNAGASWIDSPVVRDANWVSSRSPADLPYFTDAMIDLFMEKATRTVLWQAPQEPRWAVRVAASLGLAVLAFSTVRRLTTG